MANAEVERPWVMLAVLSGACAAFNGVFAKLTTTTLTTSWAHTIASSLDLPPSSKGAEYGIRIMFFVLNMTFNGVMWGLFTRALALSPSAIRVNVINTASNFLITAVMGYLVFKEHLPALWFVGAGMLVAGSVIIGARDEGSTSSGIGHDQPSEGSISVDNGPAKATGVSRDALLNDAKKRRPLDDSTNIQ